MASPLGWFRRHQRGMMVVFGMVLMGIFGLGSVAMMIQPGQINDRYGKETAVKWSGGNISKSKLENVRYKHYATIRFLEALERASREQNEKSFNSVPSQLRIQPVPQNIPPNDLDAYVMERILYAKAAEDQGVVVNDAMVNDHFQQIATNSGFKQVDWELINQSANGDHVELVEIRNQMKIELAHKIYQVMMYSGLPNSPNPTEAANGFLRFNQLTECSTYPLKVVDYLTKVEDEPSNSELKKLYEEGKYRVPDGAYLEPGFKQNKRVNVQYLYGDPNVFLENEMRNVTDAEVQAKYEELVEAEDGLVMEQIPPEETELNEDAPEPGDAPTPPQDIESTDPSLGGSSDDPAPMPGTDPGTAETTEGTIPEGTIPEGTIPGGTIPEGTIPEGTIPEGTIPEGAIPEGAIPEGAIPEGAIPESSSTTSPTTGLSVYPRSKHTVFTSLQQDETPEVVEEVIKQLEDLDPPTTQDSDPAPNPESSENPNASEQTDDPDMLDDGSQDEKPMLPILQRPMKLDEELARKIRISMVRALANAKLETAVSTAQAEVQDLQFDFIEWEALTDQEKKDTEKPVIDLKALAREFGLEQGETGLVSLDKLIKSEFGKKEANRVVRFRKITVPFGVIIATGLDKRNIMETDTLVENLNKKNYVWWLAEKHDIEIRSFADSKEEVLEYWRYQQARELALADAKSIAEKLNSSNELLSESKYAKNDKVTNTGEFTWFSENGFATPENVEFPGDQFMTAVFETKLSEAGAAFNELEDTVYVFQKISEDKRSDETLREEFLSEFSKFQQIPGTAASMSNIRGREMGAKMRDNILKRYDVNWVSR